jgi:hypothetical protein
MERRGEKKVQKKIKKITFLGPTAALRIATDWTGQ